jgi:hypothetical protein
MAKEYDLIAGQWIRWRDWSLHGNPKATKVYAMVVTGTHPKYGLDGWFLDRRRIDGYVHFDLSGVSEGDIVKVSGGSHKNDHTGFWRIEAIGETLRCSRESESDVYEAVSEAGWDDPPRDGTTPKEPAASETSAEANDLRADVIEAVKTADTEVLNEIAALLGVDPKGDRDEGKREQTGSSRSDRIS